MRDVWVERGGSSCKLVRYLDFSQVLDMLWDISVTIFKLGSSCNLDKDLSKNKGYDQLVKCKNIEIYLHYIYL